jgi:long-chain acyl-CoA synthetase
MRRRWSMTANGCHGDSSARLARADSFSDQQHAAPQIGMLLRNRPGQVAAFLGVLLGGGTVVTINPARGDERTKADIDQLALPMIIGEPDDLATLGELPGTTAVVSISGLFDEPKVVAVSEAQHAPRGATRRRGPNADQRNDRSAKANRPQLRHAGAQRDGPPARSSAGANRIAARRRDRQLTAGAYRRVFRILQCVAEARSFVLLERFELNAWAEAVRKHRPRTVSLVPAALRTVLHSDLPQSDLESIRAVTCGTAPLSADDADAFTEKYGIPVLTSYAATEFGGGVAGWTLADYQQHWQAKRGSVGRPTPGAQLRIVDDGGTPLGRTRSVCLEVKPEQLGPSAKWMRTTDMARIDDDGFVWVVGRADQAIIRGGFKVMPDDVRTALEGHPSVAGAAVVGPARRAPR